MVAKKRIVFVTPASTMKSHIEANVEEGNEKEVALKDCHLLDAALESDKIIASNDDKARAVFCKIALNKGEIRTISWFSAVADHHFFCDTLTPGGFIPKSYYLLPPAP